MPNAKILGSIAVAAIGAGSLLRPLDVPVVPDAGGAADSGTVLDCVGVLRVQDERGRRVANAKRFGESNAALRTAFRLSELATPDLGEFCDWEACIRANGYAHACGVGDAGWEHCRTCDGGGDCDGFPMSEAECVSHASDPGRATCHVGLLQECLLQRAIRDPADSRITETCARSAQACAGEAYRLRGPRSRRDARAGADSRS